MALNLSRRNQLLGGLLLSSLLLALPKSVDRDAITMRVEAICLVRDLINTPANDMGPAALSASAGRAVSVSPASTKAKKVSSS